MLRRYDYRCGQCGWEIEVREDLDPAHPHVCYSCRVQMHRKPAAVGVVFKGSGYYCTDHRKGGTTE